MEISTTPAKVATSAATAKQYAVFPIDRLQQAQMPQVQQVYRNIETTHSDDVGNLDMELRRILADNEHRYPDMDTKVKALKAVLHRFIAVNQQMRAPFTFPIKTAVDDENEAIKSSTLLQEVEGAAGIMYKNKAKALLARLAEIPELKWNERKEVLVDEKVIPGSNIITLLVDIVKPFRKTFPAPVGWAEVAGLLSKYNVSSAFIGNDNRYRMFRPEEQQQQQQAVPIPAPRHKRERVMPKRKRAPLHRTATPPPLWDFKDFPTPSQLPLPDDDDDDL